MGIDWKLSSIPANDFLAKSTKGAKWAVNASNSSSSSIPVCQHNCTPLLIRPVYFSFVVGKEIGGGILLKTLGFTYLNAHVYSDTVFFLGNFSKNFLLNEKIYFGLGASIASFIFFFLLGYLSTYFSKYAQKDMTWKCINIFIIAFMSLLTIYIVKETLYFL